MLSVPANAGVAAALCAALAVLTPSSGSALECKIVGSYQGKATAKGLCPALDVTLDVKDSQRPQCNVTGKATYNTRERDVECTRMEYEAADGYTLEGSLTLSFNKDYFLGFYGSENCDVMRLRITTQSSTCEVELTKNP
jgi:hypothetical protein